MTAPQRPEPLHQDPDPRYVAGPETVRAMRNRETAAEARTGVGAFALMLVAIALVAILALLVVAPRGVPDPTVVPGSNAPGTGDRQGLPGAPRSQAEQRRPGAPANDAVGAPNLPDTATAVTGRASWFCQPGVSRCTRGFGASGAYAAAGPALRVGDWRGRIVTVCSIGTRRCVNATLVDWCQCPDKVIDLYRNVFAKLGNPSRGILRVSVTWGGQRAPSATLPPTSTQP